MVKHSNVRDITDEIKIRKKYSNSNVFTTKIHKSTISERIAKFTDNLFYLSIFAVSVIVILIITYGLLYFFWGWALYNFTMHKIGNGVIVSLISLCVTVFIVTGIAKLVISIINDNTLKHEDSNSYWKEWVLLKSILNILERKSNDIY